MKTHLLPALLFSLLAATLQAQVKKSPATAAVTLPTPSRPAIPSVSLALKADEAIRNFDVPLQSDEDKPVQVFGAQTTGSLYVVDYPKTISAKGSATLSLLYIARANSSSDSDSVRLITDHGEKVVQVLHNREQVVQLDTTSLQWTQDDAPVAKTVTLTVAANSVVPRGAKVLGAGATATLESLGDNRYRVSVTPNSTARPQQFPVSIQFSPALPDLPTVISCSVTSRN